MADIWYRRFPKDFINATTGLTLEEKGAFTLVVDLIYSRGGTLPDDARYLAGICNCSLGKWSKIRARLLALGKITVANGEMDAPIIHRWVNWSGREAIPAHVRRAVFERDGERCVYCGGTDGPFHLDHVLPFSKGGQTTIANLAVSCGPCNLSKGARTPAEWRP